MEEVIDVLREDFSRVGLDGAAAEFGVSALAESCGMASFAAASRSKRGASKSQGKAKGKRARKPESRPVCQYYQFGKW